MKERKKIPESHEIKETEQKKKISKCHKDSVQLQKNIERMQIKMEMATYCNLMTENKL